MALHWPTFFTRLGSAIVFAIIMMAGLLWNEWAFVALVALIQALCLRDYFRLVRKIDPATEWPHWMPLAVQAGSFLLLLLLASSHSCQGLGARFRDFRPAIWATHTNFWMELLCLPALLLLAGILSKKTYFAAAMQSMGGLAYITLSMALLYQLHTISLVIPLALVLMIWMNDTMAYLVGSFIGKTPFSPISPKKTWEGTAGGAILTLAGAGIWGWYSHLYTMTDWMALALCASIAGTAGDLLESKLKRMAGVKDSGAMMPGHGGALDRFDSLLVATPFAFCYAYLFMPYLPVHIF